MTFVKVVVLSVHRGLASYRELTDGRALADEVTDVSARRVISRRLML